jgi:hypothetical protein
MLVAALLMALYPYNEQKVIEQQSFEMCYYIHICINTYIFLTYIEGVDFFVHTYCTYIHTYTYSTYIINKNFINPIKRCDGVEVNRLRGIDHVFQRAEIK